MNIIKRNVTATVSATMQESQKYLSIFQHFNYLFMVKKGH